jgi:hypothetical protein
MRRSTFFHCWSFLRSRLFSLIGLVLSPDPQSSDGKRHRQLAGFLKLASAQTPDLSRDFTPHKKRANKARFHPSNDLSQPVHLTRRFYFSFHFQDKLNTRMVRFRFDNGRDCCFLKQPAASLTHPTEPRASRHFVPSSWRTTRCRMRAPSANNNRRPHQHRSLHPRPQTCHVGGGRIIPLYPLARLSRTRRGGCTSVEWTFLERCICLRYASGC